MSEPTTERALSWIRTELGEVKALHRKVIAVIWVTVYRALEIGSLVRSPGEHGLVSDALRGGDLMRRLEQATLKLDFLKKMIPAIRSNDSSWGQAADSQMLIDMLKYDLLDAPNMSVIRRALARKRAQVDPMYDLPIPHELMQKR